jgi:hypothetical protein
VSPATLLAHLRAQGVRIANEAGHLVLEEVGAPLPTDVLSQVRAEKTALLALLRRERERPTPCPCGECKEPGAVQHGPRCFCGPCLDLDPELEELRAKIAADDAAAKADAAYETEERESIQAEGCTPAELEALRAAKSATVDAVDTKVPASPDAGPPWDRPGPWRWVNPENSPDDLALLAAIDRLDQMRAAGAPISSCCCCGDGDWWVTHDGLRICRRCHPPVPGAEVAEIAAPETAAGAREGA